MTWREIDRSKSIHLLYPLQSVVITSAWSDFTDAMVAVWSIPLSYNPPLVGVAIAPERFSYRLITNSGVFAINLLTFEYSESVNYLGSFSGRYVKDKIARARLTIVPGKKLKVPVIAEASGVAECKVRKQIELGDHDLFVGEVVIAYADERFDNYWKLELFKPLLYHGTSRINGTKRVYVTIDPHAIQLPYEQGPEKRSKDLNRILEIAKELKDKDQLDKLIEQTSKELEIDPEDVKLLIEQLRRNGKIKI
ncbi:MAG: flavin reductase family protein [Thermoprotei archaeon]|jgi:flavin reductase (DIM6/NTAB) family NADH-FMN oxidoreductase RutF